MRAQISTLRSLRGKALVFYSQQPEDLHHRELLLWTGLFHRCRETVFADGTGRCQRIRRFQWLWLWPRLALSLLLDGVDLVVAAILILWLRSGKRRQSPITSQRDEGPDLVYLGAYPQQKMSAGGAMSHAVGVLHGLAESGATCEIYSTYPIPQSDFLEHRVSVSGRPHMFRESLVVGHNLRFFRQVRKLVQPSLPRAFYQRHGRFLFAGAMLSRWMDIPLLLEYNGSEVWVAQHWDPCRFRWWLRLCEQVSVSEASLIITVSHALRDELVQQGIPEDRILVNPNAVDSEYFRPGVGGDAVRQALQVGKAQVLVGFVSTFSHFHGPLVLAEAIDRVLSDLGASPTIRFLLVGDGLLLPDVKRVIGRHMSEGRVLLTGLVSHDQVRAHLDACDILVSPHVPMPDGRPFIGSPTKLFEYMALGKAIVASNLDQIAEVLDHGQSAWLVEPGNVEELAAAILMLATNSELRRTMGARARQVVADRHTWKHNAERVLEAMGRERASAGKSVERRAVHV